MSKPMYAAGLLVVLGGFAFFDLHTLYYINIIDPNPITNVYHLYSPLGKGYSFVSKDQRNMVNWLLSELGPNFNYKMITDKSGLVNTPLLKAYAAEKNVSLERIYGFEKVKEPSVQEIIEKK
jgi:hypothetical protein